MNLIKKADICGEHCDRSDSTLIQNSSPFSKFSGADYGVKPKAGTKTRIERKIKTKIEAKIKARIQTRTKTRTEAKRTDRWTITSQ